MNLRLANMDDLPQLKAVYKKIIDNMNKDNLQIWDDIYPCEFLGKDIENSRLYVLVDNNEITSAFALCNANAGADYVTWENKHSKALYIDRLGVNVDYMRKGIGSITLNKAITLAGEKGAQYLRLFVVDINKPAINLYIKNGFKKVDGTYNEIIDDDLVLHEFGFEIKTAM
ncbi:MAG: GNAT family N-acetyltransferase [Angelakisella sp.]